MTSTPTKLLTILSTVLLFYSFGSTADAHKRDYSLVPKCMESDGRYRWEILNDTGNSPSYVIAPFDNDGSTATGNALPSGSGDGEETNRTVVYTTKASPEDGGIKWQLTIDGNTYKQNANTAPCTTAANNSTPAPTAKVDLCHIPPGNPSNAHVISVGTPAYAAHEAHGDSPAPCGTVDPCKDPSTFASCEQSGIVY